MGAHSFEDYGRGATPQEAYDRLKSDAQYEHGHSPYSGTIATTSGFFELSQEEYDEESARDFAMSDASRESPYLVGKWDNCICIKADNQPGPIQVGAINGEPIMDDDPLWYFVGWAAC